MLALRRITKEYNELKEFISDNPCIEHRIIDINIIDDDLHNLEICFLGPTETPYEDIVNIISINFNFNYPTNPPLIKFISKIFHPNISINGDICLDILKDNWKPIYTLRTILMSLISLLSDPNPDSPLNNYAGKLYKESLISKDFKIKYLKEIFYFK